MLNLLQIKCLNVYLNIYCINYYDVKSSKFGFVFQVTFGILLIYMWTHTITPIGKTVS